MTLFQMTFGQVYNMHTYNENFFELNIHTLSASLLQKST